MATTVRKAKPATKKRATSKKTASKKTSSAKKAPGKKAASKKSSAPGKGPGRKTASKKSASKKAASKKTAPKKWSGDVTEHSDAMDLKDKVFTGNDPKKIAKSLKTSSEKSDRKKGTPYQSAMSMLNFYINRGGKNLTASKKKVLERAKDELKKLFDREED